MGDPSDIAAPIISTVRRACRDLPGVIEEAAWTGVRWRVRGRTFAHVLTIADGWPPAYARAAACDGPATVLMFRSSGPELDALRSSGYPFFAPPWRADEVGVLLDDGTDWEELTELVTDSYCTVAPKKLGALVDRPADDDLPS